MKPPDISGLKIEYQSIDTLKANPHNARTHSKQQIREIAASLKEFGPAAPILVDQENVILAGHARAEAARQLKLTMVPTVRLNLPPDKSRAYMLADNRLAEHAEWDKSILSIELQHLLTLENEFDVTVTGFAIPEIDLILQEAAGKPDPDDVITSSAKDLPVTQAGDLWKLGKHRLYCGNALRQDSYQALLGNRRAATVFADAPYNVAIDGHATGNGTIHHREFQMASGEMSEAEFVAFLSTSMRLLARYSLPGSVHFLCMDWRHMSELLAAGNEVYDTLLNLCVWKKNNAGMGSFYRSQHELIFVFKHGNEKHRNNVRLGQYGRHRSNVWEYPGVSTFGRQGDEGNLLALHPTVKPVALVADALLDCSDRGDIVLDSFLGSGSTLIAAERVGRVCYGMEIDPLYVDVAIRRWQRHTGDFAIHAVSGKRFDELAVAKEEFHG